MEQRKLGMSILGYGCMRFPRKGSRIDMKKTEELIAFGISHGINYFDTAYIYKGSEKALGAVLAKNGWRKQVMIATKMPHYLIKSIEGLEKVFQEQLDRLQTDYVDSYLMHMLPDAKIWERLVKMGILHWIEEKRASGQIKYIGFSYHGGSSQFMELLDLYPWDFCQVQYNYMDEHSQAGRRGVEYAAEKGIPVIVMEPLRGGLLTEGLPQRGKETFAEAETKRSPAEWGLRWLWNQPAVSTVLSGMDSMEILQENIRTAQSVKAGEITDEEHRVFASVKAAINETIKIPCTGCGYCQPCPKGVDIPGIFRCYNASYADGFITGMREYLMCTTFRVQRTNASLCIRCGKCEMHCPQEIAIRGGLQQVVKRLENPAYKVIALGSKAVFR